jgi:hypothetical protein
MAFQDIIALSVVMCVLVFGFAVGAFVFTNVMDGFIASGRYTPATEQVVQTTTNRWYPMFDMGIGLWFLLLWIVALAFAFFNDNARVFLIIFVLMFLLTFAPLVALGTFLVGVVDGMQIIFEKMPITSFIANYWAFFILFFGSTIGLALYAKSRQQSGVAY